MEYDHWTIMVKFSSDKQAKYFGQFGAFRPYIFFIIDNSVVVDDNLIKTIITNSFYDESVPNVSYRKYFELEENMSFEYQYARMYFDEVSNQYHYGKFRKIAI